MSQQQDCRRLCRWVLHLGLSEINKFRYFYIHQCAMIIRNVILRHVWGLIQRNGLCKLIFLFFLNICPVFSWNEFFSNDQNHGRGRGLWKKSRDVFDQE